MVRRKLKMRQPIRNMTTFIVLHVVVWCTLLAVGCAYLARLIGSRLSTYASTQTELENIYMSAVQIAVAPIKTLATLFDKPTNNCLQTLTQCVRDTDCTSTCDSVPKVSSFTCDKDSHLCAPKSTHASTRTSSAAADNVDKPDCFPSLGIFPVYRTDTVFNLNVWQCMSFYPEIYNAGGQVNPSLCGEFGEFKITSDDDETPYTGGYCVCKLPHMATFTELGLPFCTINSYFYSRLASS